MRAGGGKVASEGWGVQGGGATGRYGDELAGRGEARRGGGIRVGTEAWVAVDGERGTSRLSLRKMERGKSTNKQINPQAFMPYGTVYVWVALEV